MNNDDAVLMGILVARLDSCFCEDVAEDHGECDRCKKIRELMVVIKASGKPKACATQLPPGVIPAGALLCSKDEGHGGKHQTVHRTITLEW